MRKLILAFMFLLLASCSFKTTKYNLAGKYINSYEPNAIHYVELNKDSTFIHYYKKDNDSAKINKGIWSVRSVAYNKVEIRLDTWYTFGYDDGACHGCYNFVTINGNEIVFNYDLPDEMNFIKAK